MAKRQSQTKRQRADEIEDPLNVIQEGPFFCKGHPPVGLMNVSLRHLDDDDGRGPLPELNCIGCLLSLNWTWIQIQWSPPPLSDVCLVGVISVPRVECDDVIICNWPESDLDYLPRWALGIKNTSSWGNILPGEWRGIDWYKWNWSSSLIPGSFEYLIVDYLLAIHISLSPRI